MPDERNLIRRLSVDTETVGRYSGSVASDRLSRTPAVRRGISAEIGKLEPFEVPEHEAYLNLLRTHEFLTSQHDDLFRARGISSPLYNVLRILRGHESRAEGDTAGCRGVPVYTVAREMVARGPDITRLADRLEKLGHVGRHRCPHDRRVVRLKLTDAGRTLADDLKEPTLDLVRRHFAPLSEREVKAITKLLHKLRRTAGDA